ncbi:MAG: hypothetical protein ACTSUE_21565 [Promethearchaeota archaeon]
MVKSRKYLPAIAWKPSTVAVRAGRAGDVQDREVRGLALLESCRMERLKKAIVLSVMREENTSFIWDSVVHVKLNRVYLRVVYFPRVDFQVNDHVSMTLELALSSIPGRFTWIVTTWNKVSNYGRRRYRLG